MKPNHLQKDTGKNNFARYLNPSSLIQPKAKRNTNNLSNIHCRSMEELDLNQNLASHSSVTKQNLKTNIHFSSLFNDKQSSLVQHEPGKSKSLSKFIALFENSNILNTKPLDDKKQKNESLKRKNYNGFCYDLKMSTNSNNKKTNGKKDKENINYQTINTSTNILREGAHFNDNKSGIIIKKQNAENISKIGNQQQILLMKMKEVIQQQKRRQKKCVQQIQQLQERNSQLVSQLKEKMSKIASFSHKQSQLQSKIKQLQLKSRQYQDKIKNISSQKEDRKNKKQCREHDFVIKSLKKVINEQLNKIIELEKFKFENQYLRQKMQHHLLQQSFSSSKESNAQCSFEEQIPSSRKQNSIRSTSSKFGYGKQVFKKSNPTINQKVLTAKQQGLDKHFKSYFKMQQSPINKQQQSYFCKSSLENKNIYEDRQNNHKSHCNKQGSGMIKIRQAQSSFSRDAIQEVTQQNEFESQQPAQNQYCNNESRKSSALREQEDSILDQVDQYLSKWRNN